MPLSAGWVPGTDEFVHAWGPVAGWEKVITSEIGFVWLGERTDVISSVLKGVGV